MSIRPMLRVGIAGAMAVASSGLSARPDESICGELAAIVAAAQEQPSFASSARNTLRPQLGFARCEVLEVLEGWPDFVCLEDNPQSVLRWERLNAEILRCLPGAALFDDPRWTPPTLPDRHARFRVGRAVIDTVEAGYVNRRERYVAIPIEAEGED